MNNTTFRHITYAGITYFFAMGILEAAVVVYLRQLYYPDGFDFPLVPIDSFTIGVELIREVATIVMLGAIGFILGSRKTSRIGWFFIGFGIWDLTYYLFLKLWLNWPDSILTPDVLFLLPVTWISPVYAPVLLSGLLILLGSFMVHFNRREHRPLDTFEWRLLIIGSFVCLTTFMSDSLRSFFNTISSESPSPTREVVDWAPDFNHLLFFLGMSIILLGIIAYRFRMGRIDKQMERAQWI
jgi:hypothetical protein